VFLVKPCVVAVSKIKDFDGTANPHLHVMLTTRHVDYDGFGLKNREWNAPQNLKAWRKNWADVCNKKFEEKGLDCRIDHRTLKAQGIDREPQIHVGRTASAMERKGIRTARGCENRDIIRRNLNNELKNLTAKQSKIEELERRAYDMETRFAVVEAKKERLDEAKKRRKAMKMWQTRNKAQISSEMEKYQTFISNKRDAFKNKYNIEIETAPAEISRTKDEAAALKHELSQWDELQQVRNELFEREMQLKSPEHKKAQLRSIIRERETQIITRGR